MLNEVIFKAARTCVCYLTAGILAWASAQAAQPVQRIEGIDPSIAHYGKRGFVFPKATAMKSTDKTTGLPEAVADYLLAQLNRAIHDKLTSNEFVQHAFGVSSVGEEEENSNFVRRLVEQTIASQTAGRPCDLKKDSLPRMLVGGGGWFSFKVDCRVENSKYRRAVFFFAIEAPYNKAEADGSTFTPADFINKDGFMEVYLDAGPVYFAY
jgi:hypothetical protein